MKLSPHIKPMIYQKANSSEAVPSIAHDPTRLALLKILELGKEQVEKGEFAGVEVVRSHFAKKS